ncbi:MAG: twin transmembrane helix small protein [Pseudomonadota bacterium]
MTQVFTILMLVAMVLVLVSLAVGLVVMAKGGEFNKKYGNKFMRLRVTLQGLALLFFALAIWSSNS